MEQLSSFQKAMIAAGRMSAPAGSTSDPKLDKLTNPMYDDNKLEGNNPMSIRPSLEARVTVQERRQIDLEARIEDLDTDMNAGYKQLSDHLGRIEDQLYKNATDIANMKGDIANMKGDIANMKGNISKIEGRLDKTEADITIMKGDITDIKSTMAKNHQETVQVLIQILEHLPK
jgi:chromosome segregation ATPase